MNKGSRVRGVQGSRDGVTDGNPGDRFPATVSSEI